MTKKDVEPPLQWTRSFPPLPPSLPPSLHPSLRAKWTWSSLSSPTRPTLIALTFEAVPLFLLLPLR